MSSSRRGSEIARGRGVAPAGDRAVTPAGASIKVEAKELLRRIAGRGRIKVRIQRAAEMLGWSYTRTKDLWYGNARRIDAEEMDPLRRLGAEKRKRADQRKRKRRK